MRGPLSPRGRWRPPVAFAIALRTWMRPPSLAAAAWSLPPCRPGRLSADRRSLAAHGGRVGGCWRRPVVADGRARTLATAPAARRAACALGWPGALIAAARRRARASRRARRRRVRRVLAPVMSRTPRCGRRTDAHAALGNAALARARRVGVGAAWLPLGHVSRVGAGEAVRARGGRWQRGRARVAARARLRMAQDDVLFCSSRWPSRGAPVGTRARLPMGQPHVLRCSWGGAPEGVAVGARARLRVGRRHVRLCSSKRLSRGAAVGARAGLRVGQRHMRPCSLEWPPRGAAVGARARLRVEQKHMLLCS